MPFHPHGLMTQCHMMFWELLPSVDHVVPVARGGADAEPNWATCSMVRNSIKSNWSLDEIGWTLRPPGDFGAWDGATRWFVEQTNVRPELMQEGYVRRWRTAIDRVLASATTRDAG